MAHLKVRIYADQGVSEQSLSRTAKTFSRLFAGAQITAIDASEIVRGDWVADTTLFVMPGGRDRFFMEKLRGMGNHHIRKFVNLGGTYVGFCGGAYYASKTVRFAEGTCLEVCEDRELSFFPGDAVGPVFKTQEFAYTGEEGVGESGACVVSIAGAMGVLPAYYNGGCLFHQASSFSDSVEVVATYAQLNGTDTAAVVRCRYGEGVAVLSGVHLETEVPQNESVASGLSSQTLLRSLLH